MEGGIVYSFFLGLAAFLTGFMFGAGIVAVGQQAKDADKKAEDIFKNKFN